MGAKSEGLTRELEAKAELVRSGTLFKVAPPMTVEQVILGGLVHHIDEHFGSIRRTVGR